jgi:hypothetical protein
MTGLHFHSPHTPPKNQRDLDIPQGLRKTRTRTNSKLVNGKKS